MNAVRRVAPNRVISLSNDGRFEVWSATMCMRRSAGYRVTDREGRRFSSVAREIALLARLGFVKVDHVPAA
jgi:hypothetical protein